MRKLGNVQDGGVIAELSQEEKSAIELLVAQMPALDAVEACRQAFSLIRATALVLGNRPMNANNERKKRSLVMTVDYTISVSAETETHRVGG